MDLPCIIESHKTVDSKSFYKTADICQVQFYHVTKLHSLKALNQSSIQSINSLELLYCDNLLATSVPLIHAGHIFSGRSMGDQGTSPPPPPPPPTSFWVRKKKKEIIEEEKPAKQAKQNQTPPLSSRFGSATDICVLSIGLELVSR